jgi:hypothetical protein
VFWLLTFKVEQISYYPNIPISLLSTMFAARYESY